MARVKMPKIKIKFEGNYRETYFKKEILGGLISWWVLDSAYYFGQDLAIVTKEKFNHVIINGIEYEKVEEEKASA